MATHEFGIMPHAPIPGKRYDIYEAQKYNCIAVHDESLERIAASLQHISFYWHTTDAPAKGPAYTGITLIPPAAMPPFISAIENMLELKKLKELLKKALDENKWVIHFGI